MTNRVQDPQVDKRQNSWYLKTGYIHHFLCKCGQIDQFGNIVSTVHHPDHCCSFCGNTHYLDSLMFFADEKVIRWSIFNWNIETTKTEQAWIVKAYASIPLFDHAIQKISFKKIVLATNTLFFTGESLYQEDHPMIMKRYVYNHLAKATLLRNLIEEDLENLLCAFTLASPIETISWIEEERIEKLPTAERIKLFSFFLKHDHLKEYDFFYWDNFEIFYDKSKEYPSVKEILDFVFNHRKEKSIKKAYFKSYEESMERYSSYNHTADYLFARHIEDRNFLLALIKIDPKVKHVLFDEVSMVSIEHFLEFLREHYTQKAVTKIFASLDRGSFRARGNIVRDTIWMFHGEAMNFIREHYSRVPPSIQKIHDEFIRINSVRNASMNGKVEFAYEKNDLKAQTQKDLLEYRLPETIHMLQQWSQELRNCMYGYSRAIHHGNTIIYGVFKENTLTYAIEIRGRKIVQALGKCNKHIEAAERVEIDMWFKDVYIPAWMRSPVKGAKRGENYERV